jgi:hypothetical protein
VLHRRHALPGGWVNGRVASRMQGETTAPYHPYQPPTSLNQHFISHLPPPYQPLTSLLPALTTSYHPPPGCKATECWEKALLRKHTAGGVDAEAIGDFMLVLCCCHTVIPEEVDGEIQYQAPYYG